jgi:hypothetical protein
MVSLLLSLTRLNGAGMGFWRVANKSISEAQKSHAMAEVAMGLHR